MCTGWMAELYYGMNRVTATRAGKKFSKDVWKLIIGNAAQLLAAMKQTGTQSKLRYSN